MSARNAGLRLVSRINRWTIAGAVALSGLISLVAAKSFHGHTVSASAQPSGSGGASSSSPSVSSNTGNTGNSGSSGSGLEQPSQAPAPAPSSSGPVVSGGS